MSDQPTIDPRELHNELCRYAGLTQREDDLEWTVRTARDAKGISTEPIKLEMKDVDAHRKDLLASVLDSKKGLGWPAAFDRMTDIARTLQRELNDTWEARNEARAAYVTDSRMLNAEIATLRQNNERVAKILAEIVVTCGAVADGSPDAAPRDWFANMILGIIERDGK